MLIVFAAAAGSGAMVGMIAWLLYRLKRLEPGGTGNVDVRRLANQVDAMQEQVTALRDDVGGLHERVDFAERLLTPGKPDDVAT